MDLQEQIKKLKADTQNKFVEMVESNIDWWIEKANKKGYEPTQEEREAFGRIVTKLVNMQKWF